jgi:hypothetical protein
MRSPGASYEYAALSVPPWFSANGRKPGVCVKMTPNLGPHSEEPAAADRHRIGGGQHDQGDQQMAHRFFSSLAGLEIGPPLGRGMIQTD